MRNVKEVLEEITSWAKENPDIRTVLLVGSRADPDAKVDLLSDYDIEIAVNDPRKFLDGEGWLSAFGNPLVIIPVNEDFKLRMVIYKDYIRIDFRIYSVEDFKQIITQTKLPQNLDNGYKILLDKDGIALNLKTPAYDVFIITKPSKEEFLATVTDFWWDTTYVAKSLWRDEIFYAKYMLDSIIRFSYLRKIIEWHISAQYNWGITTNKYGRYFKHYLDAETRRELEKTFAGSEKEENWNALLATLKLFRRLATTISQEIDCSYPEELDAEISSYLNRIKTLDKSATDIN
ncbi:MAG TPA: aminoglycoside 6-adenylyltransferase [Segetibacter sp.]|nr:aminoglycoside 6-adenylyltransferase [Segetibacter sp.]